MQTQRLRTAQARTRSAAHCAREELDRRGACLTTGRDECGRSLECAATGPETTYHRVYCSLALLRDVVAAATRSCAVRGNLGRFRRRARKSNAAQ